MARLKFSPMGTPAGFRPFAKLRHNQPALAILRRKAAAFNLGMRLLIPAWVVLLLPCGLRSQEKRCMRVLLLGRGPSVVDEVKQFVSVNVFASRMFWHGLA